MSTTKPQTTGILHGNELLSNVLNDIIKGMGSTTNVRDHGVLGDYNATAGTGQSSAATDAALANAVIAMGLSNLREGGVRSLYFPSGHYLIGSVTLPSSLGFGVNIVGAGMFSSFIWSDVSNTNPTFNSEIELVRFESLWIVGAGSQTSDSSKWKAAFYKGKLANKNADIDVSFNNCYMGYSGDFIECHGRGVVVDPSCIVVYCGYLLNIVCDTDINWNTTDTGKSTTGMRHYNISPGRCDVVSQFFRVTGTGYQKDHIYDILINCSDVLSMDRIGTFTDATITKMTINCGVGLNSFSGAPLVGKRLIDCNLSINTAKQYDRDAASTNTQWGIVQLTGSFSGLRVTGNYHQLRGYAVTIGSASANLVVDIDVQSLNLLPAGDGNFIAVRGADVNGLDVTIRTSGVAPTAGTCFFFAEATQSSPTFRCWSNYNGFKLPCVLGAAPVLYVGGVAATSTAARREMQLVNGELVFRDYYAYTRSGTTGSTIRMSLQSAPIADLTGVSTLVGEISIMNTSLTLPVFPKIDAATGRILFYKSTGSELLESDLPATFTISLRGRYKFQ